MSSDQSMSDDDIQASPRGRELIKNYQLACDRKARAEREVGLASSLKTEARRKLAHWLMPSDAKPGEKFSIWSRDQHGNECLVEVTAPGLHGEPVIIFRYRR